MYNIKMKTSAKINLQDFQERLIQRDEKNKITYVCFIDKAITLTHVVDDDGGNDTCHVHKQQPGRDVYKEGEHYYMYVVLNIQSINKIS
jgi:hypothetical protein